MSDGYPGVPEEKLAGGGWERRLRSAETVFSMPTASVVGKTVLYGDADLQGALSDAEAIDPSLDSGAGTRSEGLFATGNDDAFMRFFFATALTFRPPLAPGIGPATMYPPVRREARRAFADDLRDRGFEDVDRGRSQRVRIDAGDRARLSKFTATFPLRGDGPVDRLDVEGWLGVWTCDGSFRIAGGAYPVSDLHDLLEEGSIDRADSVEPGTYRQELLDLIRAVE